MSISCYFRSLNFRCPNAQSLVLSSIYSSPLVLPNFKVDDLQTFTSKLSPKLQTHNEAYSASSLGCLIGFSDTPSQDWTSIFFPHPPNSLGHLSWCQSILPVIQAKVLGSFLTSLSHTKCNSSHLFYL